jgi:hypothetical protein
MTEGTKLVFDEPYGEPDTVDDIPKGEEKKRSSKYPIKHWSYSSLMSYLRNPLAWHKRYVEKIYDTPSSPAGIIGRSGHVALQHFYGGLGKEAGIELGLEYLRKIPDFEIEFGVAESRAAQKKKRASMEEDYLQAIGFYLARPPRYKVLGIEVSATAKVEGLPIAIKAISDLVVESKGEPGAVDIVDHKFVDSFSKLGADKPLFVLQAIFNYSPVLEGFGKPPRRFILQECKKRKNRDGGSQMRRHVIEYKDYESDFTLFHRLISDATEELVHRKTFLPNPSDMFEGKDSFELYRLGLAKEKGETS